MLTRLAPTPSGYLHTGNIFNLLLNWLWARSNGGKVLLRIDDGDTERKRKEYVDDIFRVLDWLGLDWDIGPSGPDDFENNWSQIKRKDVYNNILNELVKKDMVFACDCSRKQICNCTEKKLSLLQPNMAWKIKAAKDDSISFDDKALGKTTVGINPFVIRKKDGFASYQLCSLADDRRFNVTHICRGKDLEESTAMQLYIDSNLTQPYFYTCTFWHHLLMKDNNGIKLSKSAGHSGQSIMNTTSKEKLFNSFTVWMGWQQPNITLPDMLQMPVFASHQ